MAAQPADRFPAVGEMVLALEGYLEETGLGADKVVGELGRYFQAPAAYEMALKERMVDHLTRRGQDQLATDDRAAALDVFDRVLTIDPSNSRVLEILDGINRRKRRRANLLAAGFVAVLAVCAWMVHRNAQPPPDDPSPMLDAPGASPLAPRRTEVAHVDLPATPAVVAPETTADAATQTAPPSEPPPASPVTAPAPRIPADAAAAVATRIRVSPAKDSEYSIGGGPRKPVPDDGVVQIELSAPAEIHVFNLTKCCEEQAQTIHPGDDVTIVMGYLPGNLIPRCSLNPVADVRIGPDADHLEVAHIGVAFTVVIGRSTDETRTMVVEFLGERVDQRPFKVTVEAGKTREVTCPPPQ